MQVTKIQQLVDLLNEAFANLQVSVSLQVVEDLAITVHRAMTAQARSFHTLEHVFTLAAIPSPISSLAALFHDLVYYQVDEGIPADINAAVSPYILEREGEIAICERLDPADRLLAMTLQLFGYGAGQKLSPFDGLNEFLSALFMNVRLGGIVGERELVKITACIEATIPFKGKDDQGRRPFDLLEERLRTINERYHLSMTGPEIEDAVKEAVVFANDDVASFAEEDPGMFLDNTWLLLPETNDALRSGEVYSIREYRQALQKMGRFLNFLNPDNIFHSHRGAPPEKEFIQMVSVARNNIHTARDYLGVKLLAIAVLEALAEMTGGDVPLSMFMGDFRRKDEPVKRLEDFLPPVPAPRSEGQSPVSRLLVFGRASESIFDMKNSPTSLYLYQSLGPDEIKRLLNYAQEMFDGNLGEQEFLAQVDGTVIAAIAEAGASMVLTRRPALLEYARSREGGLN